MEITNTVVTKTARHITENGIFNIDYAITNGLLERVQLNIFKPADGDEEETYLGSVHYDKGNVNCNIQWNDQITFYFEKAAEFIAEILEAVEEEYEPITTEQTTDKSSR